MLLSRYTTFSEKATSLSQSYQNRRKRKTRANPESLIEEEMWLFLQDPATAAKLHQAREHPEDHIQFLTGYILCAISKGDAHKMATVCAWANDVPRTAVTGPVQVGPVVSLPQDIKDLLQM